MCATDNVGEMHVLIHDRAAKGGAAGESKNSVWISIPSCHVSTGAAPTPTQKLPLRGGREGLVRKGRGKGGGCFLISEILVVEVWGRSPEVGALVIY